VRDERAEYHRNDRFASDAHPLDSLHPPLSSRIVSIAPVTTGSAGDPGRERLVSGVITILVVGSEG